VAQFATSNYSSAPLTDIVAALLSAAATVLLLRAWSPSDTCVEPVRTGASASAPVADEPERHDPPAEAFRAYAPYGVRRAWTTYRSSWPRRNPPAAFWAR
jgi:lactate permease